MVKHYLQYLNTDDNIIPILFVVFVASFVISFLTFKPLLLVIIKKKLHDQPNNRSAHQTVTPTIGGVSIYISLVLIICLFGAILRLDGLLILVGCLTLLFFLGLNDDLDDLKPFRKAFIQFLVSLFIVAITDVRVLGFSGILGIGLFPYWFSVLFTIFVYILIINAFNLIDGVDGLAGSLAVMACVALSCLFWQSKEYALTALCFSLFGALLPFLRLNLSKKRKIFMGDSGSMIIGFTIAYCAISFIYKTQLDSSSYFYNNVPVMAGAILFYPLLDTLRIFFIRIVLNKTSPFKADRNHIHHKFLDLGYSHKKTTLTILVLNSVLVIMSYFTRFLDVNIQIFTIIICGLLLFLIPFGLHKIKQKA